MTDANPFALLQDIASASCVSRCLHVVANIGVADALDETPRSAADLAEDVGAHPEALDRVLRLLASHGVFESRGGTFAHSPASRMLRSDNPRSMRSYVRLLGLLPFWDTFRELEFSVRTGQLAGDRATPGGLWAYLADNPEASGIFNAAMAAKAQGALAAIVGAYDFSPYLVIGDIGGGRGHLLQAVLERAPSASGVLFDQPRVIAEVTGIASDRLTLQGGDFFKDKLPVCDLYMVMEVIHDWGDTESIAILSAIRRAAPAGAKLLLIETMIPDTPGPDWSRTLDILMLSLIGGKQRTQEEYAKLLAASGFDFQREIGTGAQVSILEAVAA